MADFEMTKDAALSEVPVNIVPLVDDTDFISIEGAVAYNAAGMALRWHFVTAAGAYTVTSVTPTTGGVHDWTDQGDSGIYTLEIPASAGTINNDTEGYGWFTGVATGILPWRGPTIYFRATPAAAGDLTSIMGTDLTETTTSNLADNFSQVFDLDVTTARTANDIGAVVATPINASLTHIKGTQITETTAGRLAGNFSVLLDNADAASTKTQDDIGTATVSSTLDCNLVQVLGTAITETTSGRVAGNVSTVFDNGDNATTKTADDIGTAVVAGQVSADVVSILGTSIVETTTGNIAANFDEFFDNDDALTTKTVDDVDQASVVGTLDCNLVEILSTPIAETTSGNIAANWDEFWDNDDDGASAVTLQTVQTIANDVAGVAGSGARTITVNVKDTEVSPANLENAKVRMTEGVNTFVGSTDASGNAVFALDDATYSYAITKAGYVSETGTIVVSADATVNKDIAVGVITPSSGSDTATGVLICYDEDYAVEDGVTFSVQMTSGPGLAGDSLDTKIRTATSAVTTGQVEFTNLVRGATYQIWRSTFTSSSVFGSVATANAKVSFTVPDAASFDLPEVLGVDE